MSGSLQVEEPPAGAPSPRAHALAILEDFHRNLRAIPALAILGSLLAESRHAHNSMPGIAWPPPPLVLPYLGTRHYFSDSN